MMIFVTILIGLVGGLIAKKMKIPAAFMIGSLVAVTAFNLITNQAEFPAELKTYTQIITGTFIACGVSKTELIGMKTIIKPILWSLGSMLLGVIFCGFFLHYVFNFDLATAFLSAIPGGIADVTLMSYDFNADIAIVALFQTSRLCTMLILLPQIIQAITKKSDRKAESQNIDIIEVQEPVLKDKIMRTVITLVVGAIGGMIGVWLKIPAGALSFSMLATVLFNIVTQKAYLPLQVRQMAQVCSGTLVGVGVTMATVYQIPSLFVPILFVLAFLLSSNYLISKIISAKTEMNRETAMFATAPAGAGDMVLIASEMELKVNKTQIVLMHIVRLTSVVTIFPLIIKIILSLFS